MIDLKAMEADEGLFWTVSKADIRSLAAALEKMELDNTNLHELINEMLEVIKVMADQPLSTEPSHSKVRETGNAVEQLKDQIDEMARIDGAIVDARSIVKLLETILGG